MTEPPPRRSVWDSPVAPGRDRLAAPPSREGAVRPQPPSRPGAQKSGPPRKRTLLLLGCAVMLLVGLAVVPRLVNRQSDGLEITAIQDVDEDVDVSESASPDAEEAGAAGDIDVSGDIAEVARSRFLADVQPEDPRVSADLVVEPGSPSVAEESLRESLDFAMPYLSRYFEDSGDIFVVGLVSATWGVDVLQERFDNSSGFVSNTAAYLSEQGFGLSPSECSGTGGFAKTDFEQTVVVVDVGASCNWNPGSWFDDAETVAPHELMHVAQFSLTGMCADVPAWFGEGQAEFVGWNLSIANGASLYSESRSFVVDGANVGNYSSLRDLDEYTIDGAEYLLGALAVELLVAEHGWDATIEMLASLNRKTVGCGTPDPEFTKFDAAFEATFGESVDSFSERVWAYAGLSDGDEGFSVGNRRPLLDGMIRVEEEFAASTYDRAFFGYPADLDGDGCDTRDEVLMADSRVQVEMDTSVCGVAVGEWYSPYDGVLTNDPGRIQIDHVVALSEAWASGASGWSSEDAVEFANAIEDGDNLQVASSSSNQSKSDKDPAEWLPENDLALCWYLVEWSRLKLVWDLSMDESEYQVVSGLLSSCSAASSSMPSNIVDRSFVVSETTVVVSTDSDSSATVVSGSSSNSSDSGSSVYYRNCSAARAAGAAPIYYGEPGYRPALDRDSDGVACE